MRPRDGSPRHWGPNTTNAYPVKGFIGLVVTVGVIVGLLVALPEARLWVYISVPMGIVFGLVLHYLRK